MLYKIYAKSENAGELNVFGALNYSRYKSLLGALGLVAAVDVFGGMACVANEKLKTVKQAGNIADLSKNSANFPGFYITGTDLNMYIAVNGPIGTGQITFYVSDVENPTSAQMFAVTTVDLTSQGRLNDTSPYYSGLNAFANTIINGKAVNQYNFVMALPHAQDALSVAGTNPKDRYSAVTDGSKILKIKNSFSPGNADATASAGAEYVLNVDPIDGKYYLSVRNLNGPVKIAFGGNGTAEQPYKGAVVGTNGFFLSEQNDPRRANWKRLEFNSSLDAILKNPDLDGLPINITFSDGGVLQMGYVSVELSQQFQSRYDTNFNQTVSSGSTYAADCVMAAAGCSWQDVLDVNNPTGTFAHKRLYLTTAGAGIIYKLAGPDNTHVIHWDANDMTFDAAIPDSTARTNVVRIGNALGGIAGYRLDTSQAVPYFDIDMTQFTVPQLLTIAGNGGLMALSRYDTISTSPVDFRFITIDPNDIYTYINDPRTTVAPASAAMSMQMKMNVSSNLVSGGSNDVITSAQSGNMQQGQSEEQRKQKQREAILKVLNQAKTVTLPELLIKKGQALEAKDLEKANHLQSLIDSVSRSIVRGEGLLNELQ